MSRGESVSHDIFSISPKETSINSAHGVTEVLAVLGTCVCAVFLVIRLKSECPPTGAMIFDKQHGVIYCPVLVAATSRICVLHNIDYRSLSGISRFKKKIT